MRIISIFFLFLCLVQGVQAQKSSMPGYITGDDVFLRADHTTQSKAITTLDRRFSNEPQCNTILVRKLL
jgi:hypothetical protein